VSDTNSLESPALGTDLPELAQRCGDRFPRDPLTTPASGTQIGLTLSGGGFRATFAAVGVIRYLADCGLLGDVRYVSSVSGGSVANAMLATRWPALRQAGFSSAAVDQQVSEPLANRVRGRSLKWKLIRNVWRAAGPRTRTEVLAWAFDDWFFDEVELEQLDHECRWIFNAANLTTGVRFAFERELLGDYVTGYASTRGTGLRVATAVAASAAVPGAFAPLKVKGVEFPCAKPEPPKLLDGGAYDNTGLEALDGKEYRRVFTVTINAGGVFVTGAYGKVPLVRDLARANSLLYRQSTGLRTRWMVERFKAWPQTLGADPPPYARRGALFALGTSIERKGAPKEFLDFVAAYPEHRTHDGQDLAFVPTVFDILHGKLVDRLVYRGWWLTGATLARWYPGLAPLLPGATPPSV
jgi:NTE family protein